MHPWDVTPEEARAIQRELAARVLQEDHLLTSPRLVAGVDLSADGPDGVARAAVVVLSLPELKVHEVKTFQGEVTFPYVAGLLSFRESPLILGALARLSSQPDYLLVDGHGLAHPRRFGVACHLGVVLDLPTIGCAKSILRGRYQGLGEEAESWAELVDKGEVVGAALRTKRNVTPVFVSIGHKVDLAAALRGTLACQKGYRIPEPARLAHQAAAGRLADQDPQPVEPPKQGILT